MKAGRGKYSDTEKLQMAKLSESLKALQNTGSKKITQSQIASATGIPQGTISRYISGKMLPKDEYLQKLADFFNVDVSYFKEKQIETVPTVSDEVLKLDKELHPDNHKEWIRFGNNLLSEQNSNEVSDTVVEFVSRIEQEYDYYDNAVSAGTGQFLSDVQKETITLPVEHDADFVVPVYGDSMEPEYHSGDYVFVKLSVDLSSGDVGVFELYGDAYIKEIIINDDHAFLHSFNTSKYPDIAIDADSDFRVIGKVVGKYSEK